MSPTIGVLCPHIWGCCVPIHRGAVPYRLGLCRPLYRGAVSPYIGVLCPHTSGCPHIDRGSVPPSIGVPCPHTSGRCVPLYRDAASPYTELPSPPVSGSPPPPHRGAPRFVAGRSVRVSPSGAARVAMASPLPWRRRVRCSRSHPKVRSPPGGGPTPPPPLSAAHRAPTPNQMGGPYLWGLSGTPNLPGPKCDAPIMGSQWDPKPDRTQLGCPYLWGSQ